jgi:hypothetical protein
MCGSNNRNTYMKKTITTIAGLFLVAAMVPAMASATTNDEIIAQINALIAQLQAQGGTLSSPISFAQANNTCTFTKQLSLGMYDPEVLALQQLLNQTPDTQVASFGAGAPGSETDYFGERTRAAVIRFQNKYAGEILAPMGLSYGSGIVDLATRAQLHALCTPTGGVVLGASTEVPSSGTPTTVVTSTNGSNTNYNNGTNNYGLQGGAGNINVNDSSIDTDNQVNQGMTGKVMGFRVEASGSDVAITYLHLTFNNIDNSGSSKRFTRYADRVLVYMNGQVVGSANTADFSHDGDNYYGNIAIDNAIVHMGSGNKALFQIAVEGNQVIDSADTNSDNWQVQVSDIRYRDATNATFTSGYAQVKSGINFVKLSASGQVSLHIYVDSTNPQAQSVQASTGATTRDVPMLAFRLNAQGTPITFQRLNFTANATGVNNVYDMVDEFRLMHNGQILGTVTPSSGSQQSLQLDNEYTIGQDSSDVFTLVAEVKRIGNGSGASNVFDQGDALTVNFGSVDAQDMNGDNVYSGNITGSAYGNQQSFYAQGIQATYFNANVQSSYNGTSNIPSGQTFTITYRMRAYGSTYYIPKQAVLGSVLGNNGLSFNVLSSGAIAPAGTVNVIVGSITSSANTVGNYFELPDGSEQTFTIVIAVNPATGGAAAAGMYSLQFNQAGYYDSASGTNFAAYTFTPAQNYRTQEAYVSRY